MRLVHEAIFAPGQAIGNGPSADIVDTGLSDELGGRIYLSRQQIEDAWAALGHPSLQAYAGACEERDLLQARLDEALAKVHALSASVEEGESLREAIAFTLERGVVVTPKTNQIGLRHKPSMKKIDTSRSLWPGEADGAGGQ